MRFFLVVGVLTMLVVARAGAQQPAATQLEVTLNEAIQRALQVQPAMVQARGDQRNAGAAMRASIGSYLPTVTTNGSSQRNGGTRFNSSTGQIVTAPASTTFNGGLSASVELFDGFRRLADVRASHATQNAAEAGVTNQRFQVTLETKQAFYNALATDDLVNVAQSQVKRAQQQLRISIDKLHAGSATRSDSLRSLVDYGNARIALLQAQANLATAQANLGRQIGVNGTVRAVPDSVLPPFPDTSALRQSLMDNAPQVEEAEAQARAAGAQVGVSRATYWPTLSASIGNSYTGSVAPWSSTDNYLSGWSVRFSANWTLFNGFSREKAISSAVVARDVAQARAADTRLEVSSQLTQQLAALATAYEKIAIAQTNVEAATEDLRVQNERYRVGAATILDLLTSQTALNTAEQNLVQVRFDYLIARAQVEAVVGRTL
jgi:outer membrane protein TolC